MDKKYYNFICIKCKQEYPYGLLSNEPNTFTKYPCGRCCEQKVDKSYDKVLNDNSSFKCFNCGSRNGFDGTYASYCYHCGETEI